MGWPRSQVNVVSRTCDGHPLTTYLLVVSAVEKYQNAHLKAHKLIFGLDANTYSHVRFACTEVAQAERAFSRNIVFAIAGNREARQEREAGCP